MLCASKPPTTFVFCSVSDLHTATRFPESGTEAPWENYDELAASI